MHQTLSPIKLLAIGLVWLMGSSAEAGEQAHWVFFTDKGVVHGARLNQALQQATQSLTDRAKLRRARNEIFPLVDEQDLPVDSDYISRVAATPEVSIRKVSRWLNAVSVTASPSGIENLLLLPFVREIEPVALRHSLPSPLAEEPRFADPQLPPRDHNFDYGNSLRQNAFMNLPEIHDRGFLGEGILIGLCDAGFDNLDHRCFQDLRVEAAWDFVNDDADVANGDDRGNGQHGTRTLSILAGFDEGHLIGTAPRATYVLAKTENTEWEEPVEEDAWVAAVEWMDSLGVEIISSSLGYFEWYRYQDMDGESAVTTIAANRAVEVGIVVVNAMGNMGLNRYPNDKLIAPADGFDVFSIGATNRDSSLAGFSSHGPTYDGRTKPDFVTFGSSVIIASSNNDTGYAAGAGTSFSAPAVAGLCALLIEANPYLSPVTLKELLQSVSHNRDEPDTLLGWGIPDGFEAFSGIRLAEEELVIPLHVGWNTISLNKRYMLALPFVEILEPLVEADHLVLAKDGRGRFYSPRAPFNNIPFWNRLEGYQLNMDGADTLRFGGEIARCSEPIALVRGWQIVAYLPNFDLPVRDALVSLTDDDALSFIKDEWGRFYFPRFDFSNMSRLTPGQGYHIKLSRNSSLRYPRQRVIDAMPFEASVPRFFHSPTPAGTGMSVLLLAGKGIENGDEAAFIGDDGDILGAGLFESNTCGIALWGREDVARIPELKIWSHSTAQILNSELKLIQGDWDYSTDGIAAFEVEVEMPASPVLSVSTWPTPFNDRLTISVKRNDRSAVSYSLFDLAGRMVAAGNLLAGETAATLDASKFAAGLYVLKVRSESQAVTAKIVSLK